MLTFDRLVLVPRRKFRVDSPARTDGYRWSAPGWPISLVLSSYHLNAIVVVAIGIVVVIVIIAALIRNHRCLTSVVFVVVVVTIIIIATPHSTDPLVLIPSLTPFFPRLCRCGKNSREK